LGPIVGNSIAIPHIKGVSVIGEFGAAIIDDMLRHLPRFTVCTAEKDELLGRLVDDILAIGRKAGLVKESGGSAGVKAAPQVHTARLLSRCRKKFQFSRPKGVKVA